MDYIHELRKITGPRKLILNCAGTLIIKDNVYYLELAIEPNDGKAGQ